MPDTPTLTSVFTDIADAIREKAGSEGKISPVEMAQQIINLPSDGGEDIPLPSYISSLAADAMKPVTAATDSIDNWMYTLDDDRVIIYQYKYMDGNASNYLSSYRFVIVRDSYVINGETYRTYFKQNPSYQAIGCPDHLVIENLRLADNGYSTLDPGSILIIQNSAITNKLLFRISRPMKLLALPSTLTWRPDVTTMMDAPIETLYYSYANHIASPHSPNSFKYVQYLFIEPGALTGYIDLNENVSWDTYIYTDTDVENLTRDLPRSSAQPKNNRVYYNIFTNYYDDYSWGAQDDLNLYGQAVANELYGEDDIVLSFNVYDYTGSSLASGEFMHEGGEDPGT